MNTQTQHRARLFGLLAVVGATGALLLSAPAAGAVEKAPPQMHAAAAQEAAAPGDYLGTGVRIRAAADGNSTVVGLGYAGQGATVYCYRNGPHTEPNKIATWYYHRNNATGVTGWSNWDVFRPSGQVPHC
ncbi:hypothetical protein [Streptomyces beigongshangae]|uniref:hypothetical protein n=1 Tax=Streptomyces beigongshangae TaxID=2841597 RepID=UPI001C85A3BB|nr:hypothetical protein [Streptomyces sp. REN17]